MSEIFKKEDFQKIRTKKEDTDLYFYSGGSSGEPKLSVFTYEDYHRQMALASEGLYAAGLDPRTDLAMNLFFAGGLYGGFVSFFTILENLHCPHFPMAAHSDHQFVADVIHKYKVNTLLGMPSYILKLFQANEERFKKENPVKKIFYGGEHFSLSQKNYFRKNFGIELIKSASYGSVDAGPLAYQCSESEGSVHHLHHRLHGLEIVQLEADQPVKGAEIGRLLFTSKVRRGQKIERYEIGDIGRWIQEPCTCGRRSPRFELMGRTGDIFRAGATFLNYRNFLALLSDQLDYAGAFQIQILPGQALQPEKLKFVLDEKLLATAKPEVVEKLFLQVKDFHEAVSKDKTLVFELSYQRMDQFVSSPGSGKIKSVVDQR
jgi:phenylacetate-coenzyme A ligase PaaK-like adenylate-forming protein